VSIIYDPNVLRSQEYLRFSAVFVPLPTYLWDYVLGSQAEAITLDSNPANHSKVTVDAAPVLLAFH
jgi:hypothetical protein